MAVIDVTQFKETFHVPTEKFREIVSSEELDYIDFRVLCYLLTVLNGYNSFRRMGTAQEGKDPCNFTKIDCAVLSKALGYPKKKIKKSIKYLTSISLLEKGDGPTIKGGYRFTF